MNILNNIEFNYIYEGLEIEDGWEHNAFSENELTKIYNYFIDIF